MGTLIYGEDIIVLVDVFSILKFRTQEEPSVLEADGAMVKKRKKFKVLLVEDNGFLRKHIADVLVESGFEVTTAADGSIALECLTSSPPKTFSLILSDIEMPKVDGLELARRVKKDERHRSIPLIAITTHYSKAYVEEGLNAGFAKYIEKLNPIELINEIDAVLNLK